MKSSISFLGHAIVVEWTDEPGGTVRSTITVDGFRRFESLGAAKKTIRAWEDCEDGADVD